MWADLLVDHDPMPLRRKHRDGASPWSSRVTLIGDAAHPMTPFKGQGANQALADAIVRHRTHDRLKGRARRKAECVTCAVVGQARGGPAT